MPRKKKKPDDAGMAAVANLVTELREEGFTNEEIKRLVHAGSPEQWQRRYDRFYARHNVPPAPPGPPPAPPPGQDPEEASAKALLTRTLGEFGLETLGDWVWSKYLDGMSIDQIFLDMRDRPEYQARFPAIASLAAKGRAMTESEYIAYEKQATQMMRQAGLPMGFYDQPDDFAALIGGEVSVNELQQRLQMAQTAVFSAPEELRDELERLYGVGMGELTAYWLDPDKAQPLLERQFTSSQIAAQSIRTGYGQLGQGEAERLFEAGVDDAGAQQGFSTLTQLGEVFSALDRGESTIGRETQQAAVFTGDAAATTEIETRQRRRQATFEAGGGYAGSNEGLAGVGSSRS